MYRRRRVEDEDELHAKQRTEKPPSDRRAFIISLVCLCVEFYILGTLLWLGGLNVATSSLFVGASCPIFVLSLTGAWFAGTVCAETGGWRSYLVLVLHLLSLGYAIVAPMAGF